jgi:DNA replication protein DnaC
LTLSADEVEHRMRQSKIPDIFIPVRQTAKTTSLLPLVNAAIAEDRGVFLEGVPGAGKTLAVALLSCSLVRHGVDCLFVNTPEFVNQARAAQNKDELFQRLALAQHLILDDLGAEYDKSGWWAAALYSIVNSRYEKQKPMSATTNSFETLDGRVLRRIAELAKTYSLS